MYHFQLLTVEHTPADPVRSKDNKPFVFRPADDEVIAAMPEILECHRIGGDVDYLLKVIVPDIAGYDRTYKELIERLPALADVSALFSMERLKSTTGLPIPAET